MIGYTQLRLIFLTLELGFVLEDDKVNGSLPLCSNSIKNLGGIYGWAGSYVVFFRPLFFPITNKQSFT